MQQNGRSLAGGTQQGPQGIVVGSQARKAVETHWAKAVYWGALRRWKRKPKVVVLWRQRKHASQRAVCLYHGGGTRTRKAEGGVSVPCGGSGLRKAVVAQGSGCARQWLRKAVVAQGSGRVLHLDPAGAGLEDVLALALEHKPDRSGPVRGGHRPRSCVCVAEWEEGECVCVCLCVCTYCDNCLDGRVGEGRWLSVCVPVSLR